MSRERAGVGMERIDRILNHREFQEHLHKNMELEADRPFCRHNLAHFLDVARIGRIINLEEGVGIEEELLYGAALLHDIGRHLQYSDQIPHEKASAQLAPQILGDCGFNESEIAVIVEAIASHRDSSAAGERSLRGILYRADKASRPCFCCKAEQDCNWKEGRKNQTILY